MRADVELTAFTRGELSPRLKGRTDYKGYFDGCQTITNMVVLPQGGVTRRPGTLYAANAKSQTNPCHLVPFQFKTTQAYMLEFGPSSIRVFRDRAAVTSVKVATGMANNGAGLIRVTVASTAGMYTGNTTTIAGTVGTTEANGTWLITVISATTFDLVASTFVHAWVSGGAITTIVEIPTTYLAGELRPLAFTQSADTLYIASPTHKPATLTRSSHTVWTLADLAILDGPYLPTNVTATTLTASATTGAITVTASSIVGINNGEGFKTTDVGRLIRHDAAGAWGWMTITGWTSTTVVSATVGAAVNDGAAGALDGTGATVSWRLGKWSDTTGWPYETTFWQQRLMFGGTNNQPSALELSQTGDFPNFAPSKSAGTVIDTSALSWIISDDQVNAIRWVNAAGSAQTMQLGIGTDGSEHVLQAATTAAALTPTSVQAYRETSLGSLAYANAVRVGKAVLFVNAASRKVHQWQFDWQVNGYQGPDLTVDAEHITEPLLIDICYQKNPNSVVWGQLDDGGLIGMTYLPEQQVKAWHRHQLGGNYYGGPPHVEGLAVIPSTDGTYDELWLAVKRTINGAVVRTIEVMDKYFDAMPQEQAVFLDLAISSTLTHPAATVTASSLADDGTTITFTATAGTPFASGNVDALLRMGGGIAQITGFTSTTVLTGLWWEAPDSLEPQTSGNWSLTAQAASFSGLTHLIGETVGILGDGADFGTVVVSNAGVTTLPSGTASFATIGLPVDFQIVTMPFEPLRAAAASSQGRVKTIAKLYVRYLESLGFDFGRQITDPMTDAIEFKTETLQTRSAGNPMGRPPPLQTGIQRLSPQGSHDLEGQLVIEGDGPFPCTILSMNATGDVGDMPGPG